MASIIYDRDYMDMEIGMAYRFLDNKTVLTEMHSHNYFEYFIITNGSITHEVNGKTNILKTGDLVFIRPSDCHKYMIDKVQNCNMINVSFRPIYFDKVAEYFDFPILDRLIKEEYPPTVNLTSIQINQIKKKHSKLNTSRDKQSLIALLKTLIVDIFAYFIIEYDTQSNNSSEKWLQQVLAQMNTPENIEEGLPALIRLSNFSHGHLCRLIKKEFGMTPTQYVKNLQLQYAANLLTTSDYDILSIAVRLGFSSLSHFITIFKEKYGLSPSKYRAAYSNIHIWK